jgi:hypothetical protein
MEIPVWNNCRQDRDRLPGGHGLRLDGLSEGAAAAFSSAIQTRGLPHAASAAQVKGAEAVAFNSSSSMKHRGGPRIGYGGLRISR